jgi:hypothetical protein
VDPSVRYATKNAVYSLAYSPDGARLLAGGGHWYGPGFVAGLEPDGRVGWLHQDDHLGKVTGVCFDSSARHVATSVVGVTHGPAPVRVYRVEGGDAGLSELAAFVHRASDVDGVQKDAGATGLVLTSGAIVLRRTTPFHGDTFAVLGLPAGVDTHVADDGRRSSRMAVVDGAIVTGFLESNIRMGGVGAARLGDGAGLAVLVAGKKTRLQPVPHRGNVTAITADPEGHTLTTFGGDGTIASWRRAGDAFEVIATWRTDYPPTAAACMLAPGLVVTAQGASVAQDKVRSSRVEIWRGAELVRAWTIDGLLARALAAHPTRQRFAVGGKKPSSFDGWVHVFDVDL